MLLRNLRRKHQPNKIWAHIRVHTKLVRLSVISDTNALVNEHSAIFFGPNCHFLALAKVAYTLTSEVTSPSEKIH